MAKSNQPKTICSQVGRFLVGYRHFLSLWIRVFGALLLFAHGSFLVSSVSAAESDQKNGQAPNSLPTAMMLDQDLDGVPDDRDNCPNIPNAPQKGKRQPIVCGSGFKTAIDRYVFLSSRTFRPRLGIDPNLKPMGSSMHVLLHIKQNEDQVVLHKNQRERLQAAGVKLWEYLPHFTYYATIPGKKPKIISIAELPFIQGVSAIQPNDRLARSVRAGKGTKPERQPDGNLQYTVEFFPDVTQETIGKLFAKLGVRQIEQDEEERLVEVERYESILVLAKSDLVYWIDDGPGELRGQDERARVETASDLVEQVMGFTGKGLTVAMVEGALVPPTHPDLAGRIIHDSSGPKEFDGHNLEVAGIMVGNGVLSLDKTNRGFLPDAQLIDFSSKPSVGAGRTSKKLYYRFPKRARDDHDAVLINYSNGDPNCNKVGEYRTDGKNIDKSVHKKSISIVRAVGNTRGSGGSFELDPKDKDPDIAAAAAKHGPCPRNLESLPHPVPKNDVAVGNWDLSLNDIHSTSAVGPAADGRLKPDLVAPGTGTTTTAYKILDSNPERALFTYDILGGTSAAAPVVSGVMGQVFEAFSRLGARPTRDPLTIPPATVKAILIHSAIDVGPSGPDYFTGWGRVNAASAVHLALNNGSHVYEGSLDTANDYKDEYPIEISQTTYGLKVTLVWDDPPASKSSNVALLNDLNLVILDPSGNPYLPFDTELTSVGTAERLAEAQQGAQPCNRNEISCDRLNNVEQVLVTQTDPNTGTAQALPTGTWQARVTHGILSEPPQTFSLVVTTGECPLRIYGSTTLTENVSCPRELLEPAVSIEKENVLLNCSEQSVIGEGSNFDANSLGLYAGIRTNRDRVTVRNCQVRGFDIGLHFIGGNNGVIEGNKVMETDIGVLLDALGSNGTDDLNVRTNIIENIADYGIFAKGKLTNSTMTLNRIDNPNHAGIALVAIQGRSPADNTLSFNIIDDTAVGIKLEGLEYADLSGQTQTDRPLRNKVFGNLLNQEVRVGIQESRGQQNQIYSNFVHASAIGIDVINSLGTPASNNIYTNIMTRAGTGIILSGASSGLISNNTIRNAETGIWIKSTEGELVNVRYNNNIDVLGGGTGIRVFESDNVAVEGNFVSNVVVDDDSDVSLTGIGIDVEGSDALTISGNFVNDLSTGITVRSSAETIIDTNTAENLEIGITVNETPEVNILQNTIRHATITGIRINAESAQIDANTLEYDPNIDPIPTAKSAIHYFSGSGGRINNNTMTSTDPTEHAILVGSMSPIPLPNNEVRNLTIELQETVVGHTNGITIGKGVHSITINNNTIEATHTGLNGEAANELETIQVICNNLTGVTKDAVFSVPLDVSRNVWSEVPAPVQVLDGDPVDGYGDAGTGFPFCSSDYSGTRLCPANPYRSFKTNQISDDMPWVDTNYACLP